MDRLYDMLHFNSEFVEKKEYEKYKASRFKDKKMVVVSCMDARLTDLLPRALNIKDGNSKVIKDAGAIVLHPFGSVMRSIIVAVYELNADEVFVVGHHDCGMGCIDPGETINKMKEKGISSETIDTLESSGINLQQWLHGFDSVEDSVKGSVQTIKNHPLLPRNIPVHGLVIDPETGKLDLIVDGYKHKES
ncbi:beta-class carbonic anhydrase [Paenibacillus planticolens]|uniref:carbonic anhydrase n=1 Tax=Paenibacillus planticolens TaxID=2654976 RepID=A0ABX1ZQZ0_9BACL|nr:carbonic anhydrase [Paenibacillus planticolens]NOV01204.1 carbonic anhydrase [Paenibacillus planticolens]